MDSSLSIFAKAGKHTSDINILITIFQRLHILSKPLPCDQYSRNMYRKKLLKRPAIILWFPCYRFSFNIFPHQGHVWCPKYDMVLLFRPVSNLPYLFKLIEKVIAIRLVEHMRQNAFMEKNQSAYKAHLSTETLHCWECIVMSCLILIEAMAHY